MSTNLVSRTIKQIFIKHEMAELH